MQCTHELRLLSHKYSKLHSECLVAALLRTKEKARPAVKTAAEPLKAAGKAE